MHDTHFLTRIDCPLCGGKETSVVLRCTDAMVSGETFALRRCHTCTFLFTETIPTEDCIQQYYDSPKYIHHVSHTHGLVQKTAERVRRFTFAARRRLIERSCKARKGRLIDIGSGNGTFAKVMHDAGWTVTCIEPNIAARSICQNFGMSAYGLDALPRQPDASFDVVILWQVLEHVHDIHATLDTVRRLLRPDGIAVIAVPNLPCLDAEVYGNTWGGYDVPRHISHFSADTFQKLCTMHYLHIRSLHPLAFVAHYLALFHAHSLRTIVRALWIGTRSMLHGYRNPREATSIAYILDAHPA